MLSLIPALISFIKRLRERHRSDPGTTLHRPERAAPEQPPRFTDRRQPRLHGRASSRFGRLCAAAVWGGVGVALAAVSLVFRIWTVAGLSAVLILGAGSLLLSGDQPAHEDLDNDESPSQTPTTSAPLSPPQRSYGTAKDPADGRVSSFLHGPYGPTVLAAAGLVVIAISILVGTWSLVGLAIVLIGGSASVTARRRRATHPHRPKSR